MKRPPRDSKNDRLVNRKLLFFAYLEIGVMQCIAAFFVWLHVMSSYGYPASTLRTLGAHDNWGKQTLYCKTAGGALYRERVDRKPTSGWTATAVPSSRSTTTVARCRRDSSSGTRRRTDAFSAATSPPRTWWALWTPSPPSTSRIPPPTPSTTRHSPPETPSPVAKPSMSSSATASSPTSRSRRARLPSGPSSGWLPTRTTLPSPDSVHTENPWRSLTTSPSACGPSATSTTPRPERPLVTAFVADLIETDPELSAMDGRRYSKATFTQSTTVDRSRLCLLAHDEEGWQDPR